MVYPLPTVKPEGRGMLSAEEEPEEQKDPTGTANQAFCAPRSYLVGNTCPSSPRLCAFSPAPLSAVR